MSSPYQPTYEDYFNEGLVPVLTRGYHPSKNPKRDYEEAKKAFKKGWNDSGYAPPSLAEIAAWEKEGGWVGWKVPPGYIFLDTEDKVAIAAQRKIYSVRNIEPASSLTNRGYHDGFKERPGVDVPAASFMFTRCGMKVTPRVGGKNYLILPPTNERRWQIWKPFDNLPELPEELLPYDPRNLEHVLSCLAWLVRDAYRHKVFGGWEDIDAAFMGLLVQCGVSQLESERVFSFVFGSEYKPQRTASVYERASRRVNSNRPLLGMGSFVQKAKDLNMKDVQQFVEQLQRVRLPGERKVIPLVTEVKEVNVEVDMGDFALLPVTAFPAESLPAGFWEKGAKIAEALHVEPGVVCSLMLAILSGAIGNAMDVSPKDGYKVQPFLWLIDVAVSGQGKTPALDALMESVQRLQARATMTYKKDLAQYESLLRQSKSGGGDPGEKPTPKKLLVSDITVEALANVFQYNPRGVILEADEVSGLILSFDQYKHSKGNDRAHYLELFNCRAWTIDRAKSDPRFIANTGAAIIGGIQPGVLPKVFGEASLADGLLARFLLYSSESKSRPFSRKAVTDEERGYWRGLLEQAYALPLEFDADGYIRPVRVIMRSDALDEWIRYHDQENQKLEFLTPWAQAFVSKIVSHYSLKLALLLHVIQAFENFRSPTLVIDADTVHRAEALARFFAGQVCQVLRLYRGGTPLTGRQKRVIEVLHRLQGRVESGRLKLEVIQEAHDEGLSEPLRLPPRSIGTILRSLGLETTRSTGGHFYLEWEPERIEKLFSRVTSFTSFTRTTETGANAGRKKSEEAENEVPAINGTFLT